MMPAATVMPLVMRRAAYENWRTPVVGVALLVPVGPDCLAVADLLGTRMLPGDVVIIKGSRGGMRWQIAQALTSQEITGILS
ncbi:hypothetical protein ACWD48_05985 [Streptomyces sp. NPDC002519]